MRPRQIIPVLALAIACSIPEALATATAQATAPDSAVRSDALGANPAKFSPEPAAYSMTIVDRLKVNGIAVKQIRNVYRDGNKAMVKITVLPNAKNPRTVLSFEVVDIRTHKTWDWGPGVEECTTGNSTVTSKSSGATWGGDPFAEFPFGFRAPSEWFSSRAKIPPGMLQLVGSGTALGFETKIIMLAIPGQPKTKMWVGKRYGLILKSARLGKDGRYHSDDTGIIRFSLGKPPASAFALGGPCAKSSAPSTKNGSGTSSAGASGASSEIAVPQGRQLESSSRTTVH